MQSIKKLIFLLLILVSCAEEKKQDNLGKDLKKPILTFDKELKQLKDYFQIPGMQVLVLQDNQVILERNLGYSDLNLKTPVDSSTLFPIASLTKIFSGITLMQLESENKLSLDDPINQYISDSDTGDNILIKHVASHTSQGEPGQHFYYSGRFGWLTSVIADASGSSFETAINNRIINPLELKNTFFLKDEAGLEPYNNRFAKPYNLEGGIEDGVIDYGFSSSAGLVSNARDLAKLDRAFHENLIISKKEKVKMTEPLYDHLPYGYGIFRQKYLEEHLFWGYGQYDSYSSLYLKVPEKGLTLIILANNNLMSDPARLIYGDVTKSLFVMSFLKNFVFEKSDVKLLESMEDLKSNSDMDAFRRDKLLAQSLSASFMARFDDKQIDLSKSILTTVFKTFPDYKSYSNMSVLHNLMFLKDVAFYMELGEMNDFDAQIEELAQMELKEDPNNPYVNSYMGNYYDRKGNTAKAKLYFSTIVNAANLSPNWYTQEAQSWLNQNNIN